MVAGLNSDGKRTSAIRWTGLKTNTNVLFTAGNIDGGPKDRLLVSSGNHQVTAWNDAGQKIRTIQIATTHSMDSIGLWQYIMHPFFEHHDVRRSTRF